jgi:NAD(P)H dehydrogenase (quinone)
MIGVTGASGQLGRLVIGELLAKIPAEQVVAIVRDPAKVLDLAKKGVQVRKTDYNRPETLTTALKGMEKLLLISSSEVGQRVLQHRNVIDAAKQSGVKLLAYTSILHADTSPLGLAAEHIETEAAINESGLPAAILRNSWYSENYLAAINVALEHGVVIGSAGDGRIASAPRADYAAAAAAVLLAEDQVGRVYELAGDTSYTLTELAAMITEYSGKAVQYQNLPEEDYKNALVEAGFPEPFAALLADSDVGASKGGLFNESRQLSQLIGRATIPMTDLVKSAIS